jgi:hypothetical protein
MKTGMRALLIKGLYDFVDPVSGKVEEKEASTWHWNTSLG